MSDIHQNYVMRRAFFMTTINESTMGKQVNFYMTMDDERDFIAFVRATGNIAILKSVQMSEMPLQIDGLPSAGEPFWFALLLWNQDFSPRPALNFVKEQGWYCIDVYDSEVIEFDRSFMDEGRLVRGRIFAEMTYWRLTDAPPTAVKKSEAFLKWYDRLARWIKRRSARNAAGDYLLPGAAAFAAAGGKYCRAVLSSGEAI